MIIISILLNIVGLGIFCWALFNLAVYAFPFVVGMTAGIHSLQAGIGPLSAIVVGFVAGGFTLLVGQCAFFVTRSRLFRLVMGLLFAVPAASAGYGATLSHAHVSIPSEWWPGAFAVVGAFIVGGTARARMSILTEPAVRLGVALGPAQPPDGSATADG